MNELEQAITDFVGTNTVDEARRVLERHPELLGPEADDALRGIAASLPAGPLRDLVEYRHAVVARCREVGVEEALSSLPPRVRRAAEAPPGFALDIADLEQYELRLPRDPTAAPPLLRVAQRILDRLPPDERPEFRAAMQLSLSKAHFYLPEGDRAANLTRAAELCREALQVFTAEAASNKYVHIHLNLAHIYAALSELNGGASRLAEAAAYEEALRHWPPDEDPRQRALAHLGPALAWQQAPGHSVAGLEKAIASYRKALGFFTLQSHPKEYAVVQDGLGQANFDLNTRNPAASLTAAAACWRKALRVFTPKAAPVEYARLQHNLGKVHLRLPSGDRAGNLRQAITYFREALRFRTRGEDPSSYAHTHNLLGSAFRNLAASEKAHDRKALLRQAIQSFDEALAVFTPDKEPLAYATARSNLGNAFADLPNNDPAGDGQKAVEHYREALRYRTPEQSPLDYAQTQNNLGHVYFQFPGGDRTANLRQAVACYGEALRFRTRENAPLEYAETCSNLGNVYCELPGDREVHLREAIRCFESALGVYRRETTPREYARTQNNLGIAYRLLGSALDLEESLARALECFRAALRVYTPETAPLQYATAQLNLGNTHLDLAVIRGGAHAGLAVRCFEEALRFFTEEDTPLDYAGVQNNLGNAYSELGTGDRAANVARAIACYQKALRIRQPALPYECRQTNGNLGNLLFRQRDWAGALQAYRAGLAAGERLFRAGLSVESKAAEVAEESIHYRRAAFSAARLGRPGEALLLLEQGKARLLSEALRLRVVRPPGVPDDAWRAFQRAAAEVRELQAGSAAPTWGQAEAYEARVRAGSRAADELDAAVDEVRRHAPQFQQPLDLPALRALVGEGNTALVAFCCTELGSVALVLTGADDVPRLAYAPDLRQPDLRQLMFGNGVGGGAGWVGDYLCPGRARWLATMDRVLAEVGRRLLEPVLAEVPAGTERLVLLPAGPLNLLPLHAVPLAGTPAWRLCDRYLVGYAPSAQVLADCQGRLARAPGQDLYAVINPEEDPRLLFTPYEGQSVAGFFADKTLDVGRKGTLAAVVARARGRGYIHFSCHGHYEWLDPARSGLRLTDGELTLADLQGGRVDLSAARLVTLSACEGGLIDMTRGQGEEHIGLPAGFLVAGVPCVIAALWAVPDLSTALLVERFYGGHRREGLGVAEALREAQRWLSVLPAAAVADYAEECYRQPGRWEDRPRLLAWRNHYRALAERDPTARPFAHPYFWAAFTVNGAYMTSR